MGGIHGGSWGSPKEPKGVPRDGSWGISGSQGPMESARPRGSLGVSWGSLGVPWGSLGGPWFPGGSLGVHGTSLGVKNALATPYMAATRDEAHKMKSDGQHRDVIKQTVCKQKKMQA